LRARSWAHLTPAGRIVVPDGGPLGGAATSLLGAAAPLQLVTLEVAAARGTNPDPIRRDDPVYLRAAELADDPEG
jgi:predicted component of type VI protein secretion system